MKKLILPIAFTLVASVSANAADININGLHWLELTETIGLSRDAVEGRLNNSNDTLHGYRYASRAEVAAMMGSYAPFDGRDGYYGDTDVVEGVARHRDDFGATHMWGGDGVNATLTTVDVGSVYYDGYSQSFGFYGTAAECGSVDQTCLGLNIVYADARRVRSAVYRGGGFGWDAAAPGVLLRSNDMGYSRYGSYLVTAVPVPAAAWLFGSGLIGLLGIARRKQSKA